MLLLLLLLLVRRVGPPSWGIIWMPCIPTPALLLLLLVVCFIIHHIKVCYQGSRGPRRHHTILVSCCSTRRTVPRTRSACACRWHVKPWRHGRRVEIADRPPLLLPLLLLLLLLHGACAQLSLLLQRPGRIPDAVAHTLAAPGEWTAAPLASAPAKARGWGGVPGSQASRRCCAVIDGRAPATRSPVPEAWPKTTWSWPTKPRSGEGRRAACAGKQGGDNKEVSKHNR